MFRKPLVLAATLALLSAGSPLARADNAAPARVVPQSQTELKLSFAPVVAMTAPAVVNVYSRRVVRQRSPFFDDPFWSQFGGLGIPRERVEQSLGSGVIVRADGVIVTNNHVVEGSEQLKVVLADRREFPAKVLLADDQTDIAVLKIDTKGEKLPTIAFADSDKAQVGDLVLAIGDPFGVGQTVTSGIVSALARTQVGDSDYRSFIQTDAPINPGNSGGALVGLDGRLVGINTMILTSGGGSNGIGFAIPANMVKLVVDEVLSQGHITRPWLGAEGQSVTPEIAQSLGLDRPHGVLVSSVHAGSPASRAGIVPGDLILSVGGSAVDDMQSLRYRIALQKPGTSVSVDFMHKGKTEQAMLALTAPPEIPPRDETVLQGREPLAGARVVNLSPAVNDQYGLDVNATGVMVIDTVPRSFAEQYGISPGDIIAAVNNVEINRVEDLTRVLAQPQNDWRVKIERAGHVINFEVQA